MIRSESDIAVISVAGPSRLRSRSLIGLSSGQQDRQPRL